MKKFLGLLLLVQTVYAQTTLPYKNAQLSIERRVQDLLGRMTVEEKAGQLNQLNGGVFTGPAANDAGQQAKMNEVKSGRVGSMLNVIGAAETKAVQKIAVEQSRLGIPLLFAFDVIHGYRTIFPIPLAEACSWNTEAAEITASIAAKEAAAAGLHWTFAPMCDISNDPRWGRVMEGAGEDPYLGSLFAAARVRGFQGDLSETNRVLACVKHFAAYGAVEAGKEYNTVDVSRVQLWNKYLPPYQAAVNAGAATVMNSFNLFEGVPASGNSYLVNDILKKQWGFKGIVVSDWNSFGEMINHGYAEDNKDVALKAIQAGSMMDMETKAMVNHIPELVKEGKVSMALLDEAVGKILYYKFKLGLFEDPYRYSDEAREKANIFTDEHRAIARKAARESIVLLKNDNHVLPLQPTQRVALIGHYAKSKEDLFDFWIGKGDANEAVSLYEALMARKTGMVTYAQGYRPDDKMDQKLIDEAVKNANAADVVVVNIGISGKLAGEDRAIAMPEVPAAQIRLLEALKKTGKPVVALVNAGRPLVLTPIKDLVSSIVYCWILGTEHGTAVADVILGVHNPSGKTVMSFPYAVGQIPVYYNYFNSGRPNATDPAGNWYTRYRDIPNDPLYPFGFGLSYSEFKYSDYSISDTVMTRNKPVSVKVTVTNTSNTDGTEVVQLYLRDVTASIVRPVKELKAFKRVPVKAGASVEVSFTIEPSDLAFYDGFGRQKTEPGLFKVYVGGDSKNVLEKSFVLQ